MSTDDGYRADIEKVATLAEDDGDHAAAARWRRNADAFDSGQTTTHNWGLARRVLDASGTYAQRFEAAR